MYRVEIYPRNARPGAVFTIFSSRRRAQRSPDRYYAAGDLPYVSSVAAVARRYAQIKTVPTRRAYVHVVMFFVRIVADVFAFSPCEFRRRFSHRDDVSSAKREKASCPVGPAYCAARVRLRPARRPIRRQSSR